MKNITITLLLLLSIFLVSCEEKETSDAPFTGKIEFIAGSIGMSTNGSITIDANKKIVTYRVDVIKQILGSDIVTMVDFENKIMYSISPENKIYAQQNFSIKDLGQDMPTKEDVQNAEKELLSHLKKTGNTEEINGYTCDEYELTEEVEGLKTGKIWLSKALLDRLEPIWKDITEVQGIGIEKLLLGFPMKGEAGTSVGLGTFSITKITEGEEGLADLNLDDYEEMEQEAFMKKVMEGTSFGNMLGALGDI